MIYFSFIQILKETSFSKTLENLIKRRILRRLVWFCTVCRCPTKRTLGLFGLTLHIVVEFPMYIDTISMGLTIVYFERSQIEFSRI